MHCTFSSEPLNNLQFYYPASGVESLKSKEETVFKPFIQKILEQKKLKIDSIQRLSSSGSQVFEINHALIARFSFSAQKMAQEKRVLDSLLAHSLSVQIPCYSDVYKVSGKEEVSFVLYPKIPGEVLTKEKFQQLSELQVAKLVDDLATFLFHIHQVTEGKETLFLETDELLGGLLPRVPQPELLNHKMEKYLLHDDADLLPLWKRVYQVYLEVYEEQKFKALIHNDLHEGNLLIDPVSNRLVGVLDFEDVVYGHISRDFRHFYSMDPQFMVQIAKSYAKKAHVDEGVFVRSALAFRLYRDFTNLWKVIEFPEIASHGDKQSAPTLREFMHSDYFTFLK